MYFRFLPFSRFRTTLEVPQAGWWTFILSSDDGSWLAIGDRLYIDHGGQHGIYPPAASRINMNAGFYDLTLYYVQFQFAHGIVLEWEGAILFFKLLYRSLRRVGYF